ncbi:hypothetical protein SEA_KABOCHA_111 [Gordonia phage Kabocha]|nr:hypothetical protein SEA_KABOCHA_111 [Gordonia phage Kabocha]WAA20086.1 hypothetical protein SEA_HANEM_109 [Gordonia phage Hanem]
MIDGGFVVLVLFLVLYSILWWIVVSWFVRWIEQHPRHRVVRFLRWPTVWLADKFRKIGRWMNGLVNRKARTRGKAGRHDRDEAGQ